MSPLYKSELKLTWPFQDLKKNPRKLTRSVQHCSRTPQDESLFTQIFRSSQLNLWKSELKKLWKTRPDQVHSTLHVLVIVFRKPMITTEQSAGNSSYFSLDFITTEAAGCHFTMTDANSPAWNEQSSVRRFSVACTQRCMATCKRGRWGEKYIRNTVGYDIGHPHFLPTVNYHTSEDVFTYPSFQQAQQLMYLSGLNIS